MRKFQQKLLFLVLAEQPSRLGLMSPGSLGSKVLKLVLMRKQVVSLTSVRSLFA